MANENALQKLQAITDEKVIASEDIDFDELESKLEANLEQEMMELEDLSLEDAQIGSPDTLGNVIANTVWDQVLNQIAIKAGEDFIEANRGLTLDLRNEAHILTAEGFEKGYLPAHNFDNKEKYEQRYNETRADYQTDPNMDITMSKNMRFNEETKTYERYDSKHGEWKGKTRYNEETKTWEDYEPRTGKWQKKLSADARKNFDTRTIDEKGSKTIHRDHIISAAEQLRDTEAAAYMDRTERQNFAKSDVNMQDLDSRANQSKSDLSTEDWLKTPRADGQSQDKYFGLDSEELLKNHKEASEAYQKEKDEAKQRTINEGKQSQKAEAFRIGEKTLRAVAMQLLTELVRDIISKLVLWLKSAKRTIDTLIEHIKAAIKKFFSSMKQHMLNAGDTIITTVLTSIFGSITSIIKKIWMALKQSVKSLKEAIWVFKNPANQDLPISVKVLTAGEIVMTGVSAVGAIALGELIEDALKLIPGFAFEIPFFGSLANILGMLLGAVVSGVVCAIAINLIERLVSKKLKEQKLKEEIDKGNDILKKQNTLFAVSQAAYAQKKATVTDNIETRHKVASDIVASLVESINKPIESNESTKNELDNINAILNRINDERAE